MIDGDGDAAGGDGGVAERFGEDGAARVGTGVGPSSGAVQPATAPVSRAATKPATRCVAVRD
jgi:hypothetical protein